MPIDQRHMLQETLAAALDTADEPHSVMLKRFASGIGTTNNYWLNSTVSR
jgi:hypothetical protein